MAAAVNETVPEFKFQPEARDSTQKFKDEETPER
jgi:hypothetical protein